MIMVGFFAAEVTTAKTHPESAFGWVSLGGPMGACRIIQDCRKQNISLKFSCISFSETPSGCGRPCLRVKDVRAEKLYFPALPAMG